MPCAQQCEVPVGVRLAWVPPTDKAFSDVVRCPNDGCDRTFPVLTDAHNVDNAPNSTESDRAELTIQETLNTLGRYIATDSRDWGLSAGDALLWAVLLGWDCEEDHQHDDGCSNGAFQEVAERHRWSPEWQKTVRQMRRAVLRCTGAETRSPSGGA